MKRTKIKPNPLGERILQFVSENETNITSLSLSAGLSAGSIRQLIVHPERRPTLETCLRLAQAMDIPSAEILDIAGYDPNTTNDSHNPDRGRLVNIFDHLPLPARNALLKVASAFEQAFLNTSEQ